MDNFLFLWGGGGRGGGGELGAGQFFHVGIFLLCSIFPSASFYMISFSLNSAK